MKNHNSVVFMNIKYHENLYIINSVGTGERYSVAGAMKLSSITASAKPKKRQTEWSAFLQSNT